MVSSKPLISHHRCTNLKLVGPILCFLGFFLVTASLYCTLDHYSEMRLDNGTSEGELLLPKITIFSAPKPREFSDGSDFKLTWARQELAVRSWLAISRSVDVVLFGRDPSIRKFQESFGSRVSIEPSIDFTFLGTPFFHSMILRAQYPRSGISILIDSETILFPQILTTISSAQELDRNWFIFSVSQNIFNFQYQLTENGEHWLREDGTIIETKKLQKNLLQRSKERKYGDKYLMAWNNDPNIPLLHGIIPPFLYGKGLHDIWLINEIISSETRTIFDASKHILNLYPQNLISLKIQIENNTNTTQIFEYNNNIHLAKFYGSLYFNTNSTRFYNDNLTIEKPVPVRINYQYDLEGILDKVSDANKSVILGIAGESYRDLLMNWVCRLRFLNVTNFLVFALDPNTYEFSILQGLPVFREENLPRNISFNNCHFGTECFQRVTKMKSRMVLKILKLGYNVLISDVDIYWFRNPLPYLSSLGPGILTAQSDEFNETEPINLPRRLNSGFYFARSEPTTINAIQLVVKHASTSNLSEQPSFYDILCGQNGINRVGENQCVEPSTNLKVVFLDRDRFPNGAYKGIWETKNVTNACVKLGCFVLHNNWISGRKRKLERQVFSGLWNYDPGFRVCVHNWSDNSLVN